MSKIRHISRRVYPKTVPMIIGAPAALVSLRFVRGQYVKKPGQQPYHTNQHIKFWSTWFLLKALTTTSYIQHWIKQKNYLLTWLQMNENTFRHHLAWLQNEELIEVDRSNYSIRLCGYEAAAEKLEIDYEGVYEVNFNPKQHEAKQSFQYLIRTEEFEYHKQRQLEALFNKLDKNPLFKNEITYLLCQQPEIDKQRLFSDRAYYASRMLHLQVKYFREASEILSLVMTLRADINRGVKKVKEHHQYKATQSVSYMKARMRDLQFARISQVSIMSEDRARFYIPVQPDASPARIRGSQQEGFMYVPAVKATMWRLCDQVTRIYQTSINNQNEKNEKAAA